MSLVKWAIFGLLLLPFAEIAVFVAVVLKLGFLAALALTILTSLLGMSVIRHAGKTEVARVRSAFGERTVTRKELDGRGFLKVLGGFLLVLPGFITDILGLLLLLPQSQQLIGAALRRAVVRMERASGRPQVVDLPPGEWQRVPEERLTHKPSAGAD
jgi:UPF0716 protein FxsA